MAQPYSARSRAIEPFHVMALLARANQLQAEGHDVIHLEIGEPDFTTAAPIVAAGQAALAAGHTRYTAARGLPALREAIAGFYAQRYRLSIDPLRILITPGGSGALLLADPGYPCNRHFLRLVEGAAQLVPVGPEQRYQLTPESVAEYWNGDSVGALLASPANPTGTLLSAAELAALSAALKARGGHMVVDEIYHGLTYGVDASSVLEVDNGAFVLNSFSKYFGMTGWRLGWLVAPEEAVADLEKLAQNLYISAPSMAQHAALACFEPATIAILEERRAAPLSPSAATFCCQPCVSWVSVSPSSLKVRAIWMPICAPLVAMPMPFASISWKPNTWPSRRASNSAVTRLATMCASLTPRACRASKRRSSGSPRGLKSWKLDAV